MSYPFKTLVIIAFLNCLSFGTVNKVCRLAISSKLYSTNHLKKLVRSVYLLISSIHFAFNMFSECRILRILLRIIMFPRHFNGLFLIPYINRFGFHFTIVVSQVQFSACFRGNTFLLPQIISSKIKLSSIHCHTQSVNCNY